MHVGTLPIGELGALSHLDSFVPSVLHSSSSSACISSCPSVPFGNEVPTAQPHIQHPQFPSQSPKFSRSLLKRKDRSQDTRLHRQQQRIQRRAAARRAYRSWIQNLPPQPHIYGTGSINAVHQPKPSYSATLQTHPQAGGQLSTSSTSKKRSFISCKKFRIRLQFLKCKTMVPQNNCTPNHLRQSPSTSPPSQTTSTAPPTTHPHQSPEEAHRHMHEQGNGDGSRRQWQLQRDLKHIQQPNEHGRMKHDMQIASHAGLVLRFLEYNRIAGGRQDAFHY